MRELIFINGRYESNTTKIATPSALLSSAIFYSRLLPIIIKASLKAKKGAYNDEEWIKSSLNVIEILERAGIQFYIEGIKNIEKLKEPCLFVANHMSTLETFVLPAILHPIKKITFVVKRDLVKYPVFKHIMLSRNPIVVGRKNPKEDLKTVLEDGMDRLKSGLSIVIFPQTTRSETFDPNKFNTIGIKLALKANCPLIPVALKTDAWSTGKIIKDFGKIDPKKRVYFSFGEPLFIKDRGIEEHKRIIQFISDKLQEWSLS